MASTNSSRPWGRGGEDEQVREKKENEKISAERRSSADILRHTSFEGGLTVWESTKRWHLYHTSRQEWEVREERERESVAVRME